MATKMVMPLLGQTMEEGTIIKWFKNEGDTIKEGEPLLEVMTDKVNMEVEAPESGVLRKILAQVDDIIPVKDPIAIIGTADEPIDDLLAEIGGAGSTDEEVESSGPAPVLADSSDVDFAPSAPKSTSGSVSVPLSPEGKVFASPAAKRVARENNIDINLLAGKGTGPNGRIVEKDVIAFIESVPKTTPLAGKIAADLGVDLAGVSGSGAAGKIMSQDVYSASVPTAPISLQASTYAQIGGTIPFTGMRKAVAQNVSLSKQTSPHVTLVTEVDMTEAVKMRKQILDDIEKNYGVRISFTDIITKAACRAILDKPIVNSRIEGDKIVISDSVNIGIATALEGALVVPVVKNVQSKSLVQISAEIKELVARAREGKASGDDFAGGTFSITNLGNYGIQSFDPIITPGQSAILGVCAITEKPVVVDGEIKVRSMMNLCLSFDHRVMDGAPAAEYLFRLKQILESPFLIFV
ncbi:MAG: dihydrolipoamide acetyltransferase family protein [Armatimonadota bacterium]